MDSVRGFDFLAEDQKNFYSKYESESVLVQGRHRVVPPKITIVLPTYKRPQLLKMALESALNQKDFNDYQVLVIDNEGRAISEETETSRMMKQYSDDKILYYRNLSEMVHSMDYGIKLAQSEWVCFLHDDDLLADNHLASLYQIVKSNKKIKYISCPASDFLNDISDEQAAKMTKGKTFSYTLARYPRSYVCTDYYPGWLGALIHRKEYIDMGGMPTSACGCGDYFMVGKFMYKYGIYECVSGTPLYFYRRWTGQAADSGFWQKLLENEMLYFMYFIRKCHLLFRKRWQRIAAYQLCKQMTNMRSGDKRINTSIKELLVECGLEQEILTDTRCYQKDMRFLEHYFWCVDVWRRIKKW